MRRSQLREFIGMTQGESFWVEFVKRTDNSLRVMECKTGVHKEPASVSRPSKVDHESHQLATVWSISDAGYRSVPLDAVVLVKFRGVWELVTGDKVSLGDLRSQQGKTVDCYCRVDGLDAYFNGVLTVTTDKVFVDQTEIVLEGVRKVLLK